MRADIRCFLLYAIVISVLILPVSANILPTMTRVFITHNGIPVDDTVDFSLDCYAKAADLNSQGDDVKVYSQATTCKPEEPCDIFTKKIPWLSFISYCDLSGTYKGQSFLLKNVSRRSMVSSEHVIVPFDETGEARILSSQDWNRCHDQRFDNEKDCDRFIKKNSPLIVNESGYFRTDLGPDFRQCQDNATQVLVSCFREHGRKMTSAEVRDSISYFELRFDIPSKNNSSALTPGQNMLTGDIRTNSIVISSRPKGLVESLYCNILSVFNIRC